MPRYMCNVSTTPGFGGPVVYSRMSDLCSGNQSAVTVNQKFFPAPVDDPWLAARTHRSRWLHHVVTHPDHGKTSLSTTEGNIHPAVASVVNHPDTEFTDRSVPRDYDFIAHGKTSGGCRGC